MQEIVTDKTVYTSSPSEKRADKETAVYELLDSLCIGYERLDHSEADTIEQCKEVEKILGCEICKNIFLSNRQETMFYLLLISGDKQFKTKDLSSQINSARLSFAKAEYMEKFLNITPGSVSVLGLMNDKENNVRLLIDKDLLKNEYLGFHPCLNTSTLKLNLSEILGKFLPAVSHEYTVVEL